MSLLAVIMIFIGLSVDTLVALLFVLRNYDCRLSVITFVTVTIALWILGIMLGKGLVAFFPDWITDFMGVVLIFLAVFGQNDGDNENISTGLISLFLFCLSPDDDNLAVYVPWAVNLSWLEILQIGIIFTICSVILTLSGEAITSFDPVAGLLEKCGNYGSKTVYVLVGLYIIWNSHLIDHLWILVS